MSDIPLRPATHGRPTAVPPALLEVGFRPFFLAGAAWAVGALAFWLAALAGIASPGGDTFGALAWHGHEMVYGVGAGIVGGFLLTAVPSWTGQPKLVGWPLAGLAGVWLAGRVVMAAPDSLGHPLVAAVDLAFLAVLALRTGWQIRASRNCRNLPMAVGPLLLLAGNALTHARAAGFVGSDGIALGVAAIVLMIALIGGRIVPAFTRNWLVGAGLGGPLPAEPGRFDAAVLLATAVAFALWLGWPNATVTGAVATAVAALHLVRLSRWQGWRTGSEALVWVLHLGYLWVAIGFAAMAAAALLPGLVPQATVLHAFGTGAMGTMMLAMMTRAALGHTGRPLSADRLTVLVYALVSLAAVARLLAAVVPAWHEPAIEVAGCSWILAFALYLVGYAPKLWGSRVAGAAGCS